MAKFSLPYSSTCSRLKVTMQRMSNKKIAYVTRNTSKKVECIGVQEVNGDKQQFDDPD